MSRAKEIRKQRIDQLYSADVLRLILEKLGTKVVPLSELFNPKPIDNRDPMVIAKENCEKMGIKVVNKE